ncbi:3-ketoacyl-ACP reductase FabG2 [Pleionea sediminis]|uniref:3-ketoacyl-ACP reductase FabG2 n=1 Tax=Pleionea sediminis TaxID=2569479 RepID=UPI001186A802|nr:3-ketoacyl-ACP reductase FabG2 [Pleionea sediminis]
MSDLRRVLVTGASKGIGQEIAQELAKQPFEVTVHYNSDKEGALNTLSNIESAGGKGKILQFDASDRLECKSVLEKHIEANGAFYGVVCNAGVTRDTAFPAMTDDEWDTVIHTNLDGIYNVLHPLIMPMVRLRSGGRIVTMSSVSGIAGNRGQVNYSASKAGIIGATKALALELAKRKITVNCVAPGLIETGMLPDEVKNEAMKLIPLKRTGTAEEVASLVNYLFSDVAGYITRQVISVNGGMI